jgi:hypothetical protein
MTSAISQLRTTHPVESIGFYTTTVGLTVEFHYEDYCHTAKAMPTPVPASER